MPKLSVESPTDKYDRIASDSKVSKDGPSVYLPTPNAAEKRKGAKSTAAPAISEMPMVNDDDIMKARAKDTLRYKTTPAKRKKLGLEPDYM